MVQRNPPGFLTGIVEGFYGQPWPDEIRLAYAGYMSHLGLNTAIYCPKADPYLRKRWRENWPEQRWRYLRALAASHRERGVLWGPGLSPFALYQNYGETQRQSLRDKVLRLAELEPGLLAILFDDMPGGLADLAARQAAIVTDIQQWMPDQRLLVCPTYYSFDPLLEKHFGPRPVNYWEQLGHQLPSGVDIFWTGDAVCSDAIDEQSIATISNLLGRPPVLWDNYPVNDGAVRSRHLYCQPFSGRQPVLRKVLAGHLCNPMNQGLLSLPAIAGLAALYDTAPRDDAWLCEVLGVATWKRLCGDQQEFMAAGLDAMGEQRCGELAQAYAALPGQAAAEVAGWLRGEYTFDPACLTD